MEKTKAEILEHVREIAGTLSAGMTSARIASKAYDILDLLIELNFLEPGCCRKEILDLSVTLDKELAYAHEIAKDLHLKSVEFVSPEDLIKAKNSAIERIRKDIEGFL